MSWVKPWLRPALTKCSKHLPKQNGRALNTLLCYVSALPFNTAGFNSYQIKRALLA